MDAHLLLIITVYIAGMSLQVKSNDILICVVRGDVGSSDFELSRRLFYSIGLHGMSCLYNVMYFKIKKYCPHSSTNLTYAYVYLHDVNMYIYMMSMCSVVTLTPMV